MTRRNKIMKKNLSALLYFIAAVCLYGVAFISFARQKDVFNGVFWLCIGTVWLCLSLIDRHRRKDDKKDER